MILRKVGEPPHKNLWKFSYFILIKKSTDLKHTKPFFQGFLLGIFVGGGGLLSIH